MIERADRTGVEDGGVDPALGVADRHPAAGVGEQDFGAPGPGSRRHAVGVVTAPVSQQHAFIVLGIDLNTAKFKNRNCPVITEICTFNVIINSLINNV